MLVIWAHGFQDAGTPVSIPEDQLCVERLLPAGDRQRPRLRVRDQQLQQDGARDRCRARDDILDLVKIFTAEHGKPQKVYPRRRVGGRPDHRAQPRAASRGVLGRSRRLRPDRRLPVRRSTTSGTRASTFNYFFPGVIPGDPFDPPASVTANWQSYYETNVEAGRVRPGEPSQARSVGGGRAPAVRRERLPGDRRGLRPATPCATASSTSRTPASDARRLPVRQHGALVLGLRQRLPAEPVRPARRRHARRPSRR